MIPAFSTMPLTHIPTRKMKTVSVFLVQPSSSATISHGVFLLLEEKTGLFHRCFLKKSAEQSPHLHQFRANLSPSQVQQTMLL